MSKVTLYYPTANGCSDHNCILQDNSSGMHTNGGCQCERALRREPYGFDAVRTIRLLRKQLKELTNEKD